MWTMPSPRRLIATLVTAAILVVGSAAVASAQEETGVIVVDPAADGVVPAPPLPDVPGPDGLYVVALPVEDLEEWPISPETIVAQRIVASIQGLDP